MARKKSKPEELRGQLMLQIAAGRYFHPGVQLHERVHRRVFYGNCPVLHEHPVDLPVGTITGTDSGPAVCSTVIEAVDRLEVEFPDGEGRGMVATGGDELIDDVAYVASFALNRTLTRSVEEARRLIGTNAGPGRHGGAAAMFSGLFDRRQPLQDAQVDDLRGFMDDLLALDREDFARVMRVIRSAVNATRRAVDDPTGAYTDLVAALESLSEDSLTRPVTWDRYDGSKRKLIDRALDGADSTVAEKVRSAVLEADRAGLKRRFVSSTLARITPSYYRDEAVGIVRAPRAVELERMLSIAYNIRSRRSHVLQDLGDEAWAFTDGAETIFAAQHNIPRILTLAGLWRLVRHVTRQLVVFAPKPPPGPWDYRQALPGLMQVQLAPALWIERADALTAENAQMWFDGVLAVVIAAFSGQDDGRVNLGQVVMKIEQLVPTMPNNDSRTALVGIYAICDDQVSPDGRLPSAPAFLNAYGACLSAPSPAAFAVLLLTDREYPSWSVNEWANLATIRHEARTAGKEAPLPAKIDVLIQVEAADQMEAAGRHEEAVQFAANAIGEDPGNLALLAWEARLLADDHDSRFPAHAYLFDQDPAVGRVPDSHTEISDASAWGEQPARD